MYSVQYKCYILSVSSIMITDSEFIEIKFKRDKIETKKFWAVRENWQWQYKQI